MTSRTWLLVGAERREFDGILKRFGGSKSLDLPAQFAVEAEGNGDRWFLVANGPGARLVELALPRKMNVDGIISTGFCGALDPALSVGDVIPSGPGRHLVSIDRVAVTAREKKDLWEKTGAAGVDMESGALSAIAASWGVPFRAIRAVSDTASDDMPVDFNLYRDSEGRFSRSRIALAAMARPFTAVPGLLRLDRNCRLAADSLGKFFADSRL
jgi:adenosylhomocysteine nucleosidase